MPDSEAPWNGHPGLPSASRADSLDSASTAIWERLDHKGALGADLDLYIFDFTMMLYLIVGHSFPSGIMVIENSGAYTFKRSMSQLTRSPVSAATSVK